jgi:UPF0755 protein
MSDGGPTTDRTPRVGREPVWDDGGGQVRWEVDGEDWDDWDDDDYVVVKPESGRLRRFGLVLLGLVVFLGIVVAAGAVWVDHRIDPPGEPGSEVAVQVPEGATTAQIADILEREGVVSDSTLFGYYVRWKSAGPFQAGEYTFHQNLAMGDAVRVLDAGPAPPEVRTVTVPEGLIIPEIVQAIADADPELTADELNGAIASGTIRSAYQPPEVTSLEGLIFPDTYELAEDEGAGEVLTRMVRQLDTVAGELGIDAKAPPLGLTAYQAIVVASLIEEEARVPEERPMIARVIYNRLAQGIPLGIDATSAYEAVLAGRDRTDLDFESASPYNTRIHAGLPPTPIAAPGRASIEAALNPAEGPWIYYVLQDPEHHFFTDSAAEFEEAKQRCAELGLGC